MELYDVLDQIDQVIYLSDLDTHEIIFVNRYGKKQYGPVTPGVKWYEYLQGFDEPCAFCTNQRLREDPDHRYTWHRKLPGTGHLLLHDSIVTVNGRPCRMELAVNVSRYAHIFGPGAGDHPPAVSGGPGLCVPHRLGQGNGHQHL